MAPYGAPKTRTIVSCLNFKIKIARELLSWRHPLYTRRSRWKKWPPIGIQIQLRHHGQELGRTSEMAGISNFKFPTKYVTHL